MEATEKKDEMTELEEKVVQKRMENIEDEETRGDIDELLNRL